MNRDWDRVLSDTDEWTGRQWAEIICNFLVKNKPDIDGHFITIGPGMVGTEAWVFNELVPKFEITGFEPQNDRFNFLKDKFPGRLINSAVTSHQGVIEGWMGHKDGKSDFWLRASPENQKHYKRENVNSTTIDNFLSQDEKPAFLWLDIEGSEFDALRGALISLMGRRFWAINVELNFVSEDDEHSKWWAIVELLRRLNYVAVMASSPCQITTNEGQPYVSIVDTHGHTDVLFVVGDGSKLPPDYLKARLLKSEKTENLNDQIMTENSYFVAAMKRSGQHGIVNWLAQQVPNDSIHFNDCHAGWKEKKLLPMKDAMAVFYRWKPDENIHDVKNYFHDWKLDLSKSKELVSEFHKSRNEGIFDDVETCIYNVEDFNLSLYDENNFSEFDQLRNCKKILIVRSVKNFVGSCLQRKITPPDPGATDVAINLQDRMKLWKQHAQAAIDNSNDWYVIKFDEWFSSIEYRKKICSDLGLHFTDNGLNKVMNFGSGSSFDRQAFDEKAQSMKVLERWKQYHDQDELMSYIDEEAIRLNEKLFGEK